MSVDPRTLPPEKPPLRIVRPEPKPVDHVKVELIKIRREVLTLASRLEKLAKIQGQETA